MNEEAFEVLLTFRSWKVGSCFVFFVGKEVSISEKRAGVGGW